MVATVAAISCAATAQGEDAAAVSVGPTQFSVFGRMSPLGEADEAFIEVWEQATNVEIEWRNPPRAAYWEKLQLPANTRTQCCSIGIPRST